MKKISWRWTLFLLLLLLLLASAFLAYRVQQFWTKPIQQEFSEKPLLIQLDKQMNAHSLAAMLQSKQLLDSPRLFIALLRVYGLSTKLKAGIYEFKAGESLADFAQRVVQGDVYRLSFKIIEGTTQNQIEANLKQAAYLQQAPIPWNQIAGEHPNAEGLLLAETYQYDAGTEAKALIQRAEQALHLALAKAWADRDPSLPYPTPYALLIAASIIEKEAALPREKKLIAGIIVKRLEKRMPLQMDPTIIYAQGSHFHGRVDLTLDSPYNSYRHYGLPPTPIAMVGEQALQAAAKPERSDYWFYVARGDGSHEFSVDYEQHRQAIRRFLK